MTEIHIDNEFFDGEPDEVTFVLPDGQEVSFERMADERRDSEGVAST